MSYVSTATTTLKYGTPQVETATIVGTITTGGNATITVTGAGITGSPVSLSVAVALGDTATQVAIKVADAINLNAPISSLYKACVCGATVVLTRLIPSADDGTLNIASTNGTCVGLTAQPTSANTVSGVALASLCAIVSYPDLGSAPSKLDTTDLTQPNYKTSILGLQEAPDLTFEANYDEVEYNKINSLSSTTNYGLQLDFGTADGKFNWQGQVRVFAKGGGIDEVRKMTVVCSAYTPIVFSLT